MGLRNPPSGSSNRLLVLGLLLASSAGTVQALPADTPANRDEDAQLIACHQLPACQRHLDLANQLYEHNRFAGSLDEYQAAYILQPYALILFNIARLHHKQNHLAEAIAYYQRYIDTGHSQQKQRARQFLTEAERELALQASLDEPPPAALMELPPLTQHPPPAPVSSEIMRPIYKKWWFWTLIGLAAAGVATGIGVGVAASNSGKDSGTITGPDPTGLPMVRPF